MILLNIYIYTHIHTQTDLILVYPLFSYLAYTCSFCNCRVQLICDLVGCWIIYKVSDNLKHKLVAYELMSANDAPERDPMDWYVVDKLECSTLLFVDTGLFLLL